MKIKIIVPYPDKQLKRTVYKNETLTVNKDRGKELIKIGIANEIKEESESSSFIPNNKIMKEESD